MQSVKCPSPSKHITYFYFPKTLKNCSLSLFSILNPRKEICKLLHYGKKLSLWSRLCSRCQQGKKKIQKLNAKSLHEESEHHKNIRFQLQCSGNVILGNKHEKSEHFLKNQLSCLEFVEKINKWGDCNNKVLKWKYIYIYIYMFFDYHIYIYIYIMKPGCLVGDE